MFQGLRTVIYPVNDLDKAKQWYSEVLGNGPYFDEPFYVGFNVGGFELGLDPDLQGVTKGNSPVAYWGVENAAESYRRLLDLGATGQSDVQNVGGDIWIATLLDPFGNIFGIIENPGFAIEP
jgi:predicted enzyme related to lactoylglutathione lyase